MKHLLLVALIKGVLVFVVDCGWSTWLSCSGPCGVGTRLRTADNPVKKHQGKDCVGDLSEDCDTGKAPCKKHKCGVFLLA